MGSGADAMTLASKLTVTRGPGWFELSWRWRDRIDKKAVFASFGAVAYQLPNVMRHAPLATVAGVGIGLAAIYSTWAMNIVRVHVEQGALRVKSSPIGLRTMEIDACDVTRVEAIPPHVTWFGKREGPRYAARAQKRLEGTGWSVGARMTNGKTKRLISNWLRQEHAEEIAALIEKELRG
jgi:hypothetical protein